MSLIMTKKRCSFANESLEILMRFSYFEERLEREAPKRIIQNWCKTEQNFPDDIWQSIWKSWNVKTAFVLKIFAYEKLSSVSFIFGRETKSSFHFLLS